MLKNISWTTYLIFMLIALVGYYVIICLKYYQAEIKNVVSGRSNIFSKTKSGDKKMPVARNQNRLHSEVMGNNLFPLINQFTEEIKYLLEQAAANNIIKQEVLYSLQQLAKKYFQIKASPFQSFITNYILVESSNYSSIHISEEDLEMLWVM
jgi:hypothetical protein